VGESWFGKVPSLSSMWDMLEISLEHRIGLDNGCSQNNRKQAGLKSVHELEIVSRKRQHTNTNNVLISPLVFFTLNSSCSLTASAMMCHSAYESASEAMTDLRDMPKAYVQCTQRVFSRTLLSYHERDDIGRTM
jgi:hypothetical protein